MSRWADFYKKLFYLQLALYGRVVSNHLRKLRKLAIFSDRSWFVTCAYRSRLIWMELWPSSWLSVFISMPLSRLRVAKVWRIPWTLITRILWHISIFLKRSPKLLGSIGNPLGVCHASMTLYRVWISAMRVIETLYLRSQKKHNHLSESHCKVS